MGPNSSPEFCIPTDKKAFFLLCFEENLLNTYNVIPFFGPTRKGNVCEVELIYNGPNPNMDLKKAKEFLRENEHIIFNKGSKEQIKDNSIINRSLSNIEVIDLEEDISTSDCCDISCVDLTNPEVIVLDDSIHQPKDEISVNSDVEIIDVSNRSPLCSLDTIDQGISCVGTLTENHIKSTTALVKSCTGMLKQSVICNKRVRHKQIIPMTVTCSRKTKSPVKLPRSKKFKANAGDETKRKMYQEQGNIFPGRVNLKAQRSKSFKLAKQLSMNDSSLSRKRVKRKRTKLKYSRHNTSGGDSPVIKTLSGNVMDYYNQVKASVERMKISGNIQQNLSKYTGPPAKTVQENRNCEGIPKRKRIKKCVNKNFNKQNDQSFIFSTTSLVATNIFNPNPLDVEREGLRPIVIDGSNVAFGHGKSSFSPKGIAICVEFFVQRNHQNIKVFLPTSRKAHMSRSLLEELESKCDMVFTPTIEIDGVRKNVYDDRFIIRYAVEVGGVIVSRDQYRDLIKENPGWRHTVETRLLMFSWVDDVIMFPVDPLGLNGPSLDQLLTF